MLALSWEEHRHEKSYRERLFRDLARVSLSMNKVPLPHIGSLSFNSRGFITLSNRPLNLHFQMLENEGIPTSIPRQRTYTAVEPYISDIITFQDNKALSQPNAIHDQDDGERQLAALTALRATMHHFIRRNTEKDPSSTHSPTSTKPTFLLMNNGIFKPSSTSSGPAQNQSKCSCLPTGSHRERSTASTTPRSCPSMRRC